MTAVELLPVHHIADEHILHDRGAGPTTGATRRRVFRAERRYAATGSAAADARIPGMVAAMHRAGIKVVLDVVYNHTAEGGRLGPMLSFKGVDNPTLLPPDAGGAALLPGLHGDRELAQPGPPVGAAADPGLAALLRHRMPRRRLPLRPRVGLARAFYEVDRLSAFFDTIHPDPVLSQVKLIAEPWDVGAGGYQVGNFPAVWSEWNGYTATRARRLARARPMSAVRVALHRLERPLPARRRAPFASINFVTAHDGFTLARPRLVQRQAQRGEQRGEPRRDDDNGRGTAASRAPPMTRGEPLRARQQRNLLATLLLSQGVPMILGGDDSAAPSAATTTPGARTTRSPGTTGSRADGELLDYVRRLIRLRREHPVFRRSSFLSGTSVRGSGLPGRLVVPSGRPADDAEGLAGPGRADARRLPERTGDPVADRTRRGHRRRLVPAPLQRVLRADRVPAADAPLRRGVDGGAGDGRGRAGGRAGQP